MTFRLLVIFLLSAPLLPPNGEASPSLILSFVSQQSCTTSELRLLESIPHAQQLVRAAAQLGYKHPDRRQHRTSLDPIFELRASKFQDQLILLFYFRRGFYLLNVSS